MMIIGEENIALFRMLTLKQALKLELIGLKMSRGTSAYAIIKRDFNLKGSKQKVYDQYVSIIEDLKKGNV
jgi:hypothetical protein